MKIKKILSIALLAYGFSLSSAQWPADVPLIEPQQDGVFYLNAEAAAFTMADKNGFHVMNAENPKLKIVDGRITGLGTGAQYPCWRIKCPGGKYRVVANMRTEDAEKCSFRISFVAGQRESRVVQTIDKGRPGSGIQLVVLGENGLQEGELCVQVIINGFIHAGRLPEIQDVRLIPAGLNDAGAETRQYPKVFYKVERNNNPPLFPVGNLDRLPAPAEEKYEKVIDLSMPPPPDAEARLRIFKERNSAKGLESLCRRLHSALVPGLKGLESFEKAFSEGRYSEALEAYREFFFAKLRNPEAYGAENVKLSLDFFQNDGKRRYLSKPNPESLKENLQGIMSTVMWSNKFRLKLGAPGSVNWAPAELKPPEGASYNRGPDKSPFWKTKEGVEMQVKVEICRSINRLNNDDGSGLFSDLLFSYLMTGDRDHLRLYSEYLEDWAMNSIEDVDNCPINIRAAVELQVFGGYITLLRVIQDERPEFARDFPAPALARAMLSITETYHPYIIRAKRAELANWGIMGTAEGIKESKLMNEFQSMRYTNREFSRLARINWIQHLSLDGEGLEAWDEGHIAIDGMLGNAGRLSLFGSPVMGKFEQMTLVDHHEVMQRSLLTHYSPDGNYWVPWLAWDNPARTTIRGKILSRGLVDEIFDETEARRRIDAALNNAKRDQRPPTSDIQPYGMLAYLRDGFGGACTSLLMQNFPVRSQTQGMSFNSKRGHLLGCMRTQYNVAKDGRSLLEGSAITVNGKPPNRWVDAIPTGGKTDFCFQTPRNIQPGRFHTSEFIDLTEAVQDSPYSGYKYSYNQDILGLGSQEPDGPIRDVGATRQIFHLRGEGIFLVADRIRNSGQEREFAKFFVLPVHAVSITDTPEPSLPFVKQMERLRALSDKGVTLLDVGPAKKCIKTSNEGFQNVSVYSAGNNYIWGGRKINEGKYEDVKSITASGLLDLAGKSKDPIRTFNENACKPVSARWRGAGPQSDISVIVTREASAEDKDISDFSEVNSAGGVSGCSFRTPKGSEVWFQASASVPGHLQIGPVQADAGTVLAVKRNNVISGAVLDGGEITINGKKHRSSYPSFEFTLSGDGVFSAIPILAPIDTTIIAPQQTVFTDEIDVSFSIPTQDMSDIQFRYTLDGSDPTLESKLYSGPIKLRDDALVKVRPFRKGIKQTPWNIAGIDGGKMVSAIFRKQAPLPALNQEKMKLSQGLRYEYFEGSWPVLMSQSGMYPCLQAKSAGDSAALLDPDHLGKIRGTDRAYAVKYDGFIDVPETGVYRFSAPEHLYNTTMDAGYDLRIWIDGQEWFPNPDLHAENIWCVALSRGLHRFQASYTDFRWKEFHNEYLMSWRPEQIWKGIPKLELDGPGFKRQTVPSGWLKFNIN